MIERVCAVAMVIAANLCPGCVSPGAAKTISERSTLAPNAAQATSYDKEFTELIARLASADLYDPDAVARQLGMTLRRAVPKVGDPNRTTGWMAYEADGAWRNDFFESIRYRNQVNAGKDPGGSKVADYVDMELRIRDDVCIAGDNLVREYFKGSIDDFARSQSFISAETVFPLQMNDTKVSIRYRQEQHCLKDVFFARSRAIP